MSNKPEEVKFLRYTYDAWKRCYPKSTREDWEDAQKPHNILHYVAGVLAKHGINEMRSAKFMAIPIDEAYFDWLNANGLEECSESRLRYAEGMTAEEAKELLVKNRLDKVATLMYIPAVTRYEGVSECQGDILPEDHLENVGEIIRKSLGAEEVHVEKNCMVEPYYMAHGEDELFSTIMNGEDTSLWKSENIISEEYPVTYTCIPIVVTRYLAGSVLRNNDSRLLEYADVESDIEGLESLEPVTIDVNGGTVTVELLPMLMCPEDAYRDEVSFIAELEILSTQMHDRADRLFRVDKVFTNDDGVCVVTMNFENEEEDDDSR